VDLLFRAKFSDCNGDIGRHRSQNVFVLAISYIGMPELVSAVVESNGNACVSQEACEIIVFCINCHQSAMAYQGSWLSFG
jgi:hypothetical protein